MVRSPVNYTILDGSKVVNRWEQIYGSGKSNKHYRRNIVQYFKTLEITSGIQIDEYVEKTREDNGFHVDKFTEYVSKHREEKGNVSSARLDAIRKTTSQLLEVGNIVLDPISAKLIRRIRGHVVKVNPKNRADLKDLQTLLKESQGRTHKDVRFKAILLVLCATGMRLEELANSLGMLFKDLEVRNDPTYGRIACIEVFAEKVAGGHISYKFLTPEALEALEAYLDYRREKGELIGPDTPLFRDSFERGTRYHHGDVKNPKPMIPTTYSQIIVDRMKDAKIRTEKVKRHGDRQEWSPEGIRHRFAFEAHHNSKLKDHEVEKLMDHAIPGSMIETYKETQKDEMWQNYLQLIPLLTIDAFKRMELSNQGEIVDALNEQKDQNEQQRIQNEAMGQTIVSQQETIVQNEKETVELAMVVAETRMAQNEMKESFQGMKKGQKELEEVISNARYVEREIGKKMQDWYHKKWITAKEFKDGVPQEKAYRLSRRKQATTVPQS